MKERIYDWWGLFVIVLAFALMYSGMSLFDQGFHNVDLAHNFQSLGVEINQALFPYNVTLMSLDEVQDKSLTGRIITLEEGYWAGIKQMKEGNRCMFLSGMFFVIGVLLILRPNLDRVQLPTGSQKPLVEKKR